MSMTVFRMKVEEGKNGPPSITLVYRNPIAKIGFPPTDPDLCTAWQLFRAAVEKYPGNRMLGWRDLRMESGVLITGKPTRKLMKRFCRLVLHYGLTVVNVVLELEFMEPIVLSG